MNVADIDTLLMFDALPEGDQQLVITLCEALRNMQAGLLTPADRWVLSALGALTTIAERKSNN